MSRYSPTEPLTRQHVVATFDCGNDSLSQWLQKHGHQANESGSGRVYVTHLDGSPDVVGYYVIAPGSVLPTDSPPRVLKGLGRHPVPVVLLARLAVDESEQGAGLGTALLADALHRVAAAVETVGGRALLIHAEDDVAKEWYLRRAEFEESPTDPLHLFLLIKDLRKTLDSA